MDGKIFYHIGSKTSKKHYSQQIKYLILNHLLEIGLLTVFPVA